MRPSLALGEKCLSWSNNVRASYENMDSKRRAFSGPPGRQIVSESCRMPLTVARSQRLTGEAAAGGRYSVFFRMQSHYLIGILFWYVGLPFSYSSTDVHTVASLLKLYIRELPEPIIPFSKYTQFLSCAQLLTKDKEMVILCLLQTLIFFKLLSLQ